MSKNNKFTVIIPTRERSDTLRSAIKSCVGQNYDNLEIIVSDNCSQDDTYDVVKSYQDERIKYINPGKRLSMSGNWEFALSHATGDYVNYIGDDDAMLPRAFNNLNDILNDIKCQAFSWKKDDFVYFWPGTDESNLLSISLWGSQDYQKKDCKKVLRNVQDLRASYNTLPLVYSGVVQRQVLEKIASYSRCFFSSMTPDVYSGIAIACEVDHFYSSGQPYSMVGLSVHSTGASASNNQPQENSPEAKFYQENDRSPHASLQMNPVNIAMCVADSILIAKDVIPNTSHLNIDMINLMTNIAKDSSSTSLEKYTICLTTIRQIGRLNKLEEEAEKIIAKFPNKPKASKIGQLLNRANSIGTVAYFNCDDFGIDNVYDASVLTDHILSMHKGGCFSLKYRIEKFLLSSSSKK
jgi:glycosyltransferase involved in cell wall biosynthesis